MLSKVCVYCYFGRPQGWEDKFIENFNSMEKYGYHWLIPTDLPLKSKGNVTILPMDINGYNQRIKETIGIETHYFMDKSRNQPNAYYGHAPAFGLMFEKEIQGYDFWGWTGLDVIMGRVDRKLTDEYLNECDVWGNDPNAINGVFSLFRNNKTTRKLFMEHRNWQKIFDLDSWYAFDEVQFSEVVRDAHNKGNIRFKSSFWIESDRQPCHKDDIHINMLPDGTIINTITKEEIMIFHFSRTKRYPQYEIIQG